MPSNQWSVQPEDVRVELIWTFNGTERPLWIQLKKYLTVGENKRMLKSISNVTSKIGVRGEQSSVPEARFEWTDYSFARCQAYLLDWSLSDDDGNKMEITRDTLESLHQEVFDLIDNAIDKHETTMVNAASKKKAATGGRKRKTTSRS
jgi:hypothetical protein